LQEGWGWGKLLQQSPQLFLLELGFSTLQKFGCQAFAMYFMNKFSAFFCSITDYDCLEVFLREVIDYTWLQRLVLVVYQKDLFLV